MVFTLVILPVDTDTLNQVRYPPIESYDSGLLEVGDGYRVFWDTSGKPGRQAGPGGSR